MKYMKYIMGLITAGLLICSCEKEEIAIVDLMLDPSEISKIELRADHKTLLPDGVAKMEFHPLVYAKRKMNNYVMNADKKFETIEVDTVFLVPADQVPANYIKIYDQAGKELKDGIYSTTTDRPGTVLQFYAKGGNVESQRVSVTIREIPDESYEEIVVPVIFHLLLPPVTAGPTYEVSSEYLEQQLKQVSDIFNRQITADPNGGNVKVTFKLALYNQTGTRLQEPGKNIENISATNLTAMGTSGNKLKPYKEYILKYASRLIWNPNQYLNVWIAKFHTSTSTLGKGYSYSFLAPTVIHSDYDPASIPGIKMTVKDQFSKSDVTDCLQAGFMVNFNALLNPRIQGSNEFNIATVFGAYYGLLDTQTESYDELEDGDTDYCPDTYSYYYDNYTSIYKGNNLEDQPEDRPIEYFTSFNIMDVYSKKNSVSVDQATRIRKALTQCPSRWAYKSSFAFTGN